MGEITAAVFLTFAVAGPFVCWYLLDSKARALPVRIRAKADNVAQRNADERSD